MAPFSPFPRAVFAASLALCLAGTGLPAFAQDATGPITAPSGATTGPGGSANFSNAPANAVLDLYERLSGKHLIRDINLGGVTFSFNVPPGMSDAEALKFIESTLLLNGVAIIRIDDHTDKVITVGSNKNPRSEGVKLYANAVDLPSDDEVVSYYMPLSYINPQEAISIFTGTAPVHLYGAYVPALSAQAVILTENAGVIRQLIALKELIDVPPARVATQWIQLNRADAEKVADLLNKMLGIGATGAPVVQSGPGGQVIVPPWVGNSEPLSNEHNLISGTAQIIADPRSNSILVVTRPVNMPFLEKMIVQLDQADSFLTPKRFPLSYVTAQDILPALEAAIAQGKDEEDQVKKDQTNAQSQNQKTGAAASTSQPTSTAGASSGGSGSVSAITPQLSTPTENDVPTVVTVGSTRLMADNRSNSIIVFGSTDIIQRVQDMIFQLDRKPLQVYLATVIGELTVSEGEEFGIDILQKYMPIGSSGFATSNLNSSAATGSSGASSVPEPGSLVTSTLFPLASGLTLYGTIAGTVDAYVRALETTDRFKVVSRPSVYTTNNKLAVIASGSQVPVPSSTTSGVTGVDNSLTTTSSIAYEDVLLQLDIIPLINASHDVTLQIRQTNNTLGANQNISGNLVPIINTQEINTEVTVPDKSTVVIGGLITDNTTRDTSGVPWLSDIPILGYLFKDTTKSKERDELIIMISPQVIETAADQIAVNEAEKQRTILGHEAVETANGPTSDTLTPVPAPVLLPVPPPSEVDVKSMTTRSTTSSPYSSKAGSSSHTTTTTTTTTIQAPATVLTPSPPTSLVPILSSPAPDVQNGSMPHMNPPTPLPPPVVAP